jgi:hypothetical protein
MIISAVGGRIKSRVPVNAIGRSEHDGSTGERGDVPDVLVVQSRHQVEIAYGL